MARLLLVVLTALMSCSCNAFQTSNPIVISSQSPWLVGKREGNVVEVVKRVDICRPGWINKREQLLFMSKLSHNDNDDECQQKEGRCRRFPLWNSCKKAAKRVVRKVRPIALAVLTAHAIVSNRNSVQEQLKEMASSNHQANKNRFVLIESVNANPLANSQIYDRHAEAKERLQSRIAGRDDAKQRKYDEEVARIAKEEGAEPALAYRREYMTRKTKEDEEREDAIEDFYRSLLDEGICPWNDLEGERRLTLFITGEDLIEYDGSNQYRRALAERHGDLPPYEQEVKYARRLMQLQVQDLKNRGIDPFHHMREHENNRIFAEEFYTMPEDVAKAKIVEYERNMELYAQITKPKPGEKSVKQKWEEDPVYQAKLKKEAAAKLKEEKKRAKLEKKKAKEAAKRAAKKEKTITTTINNNNRDSPRVEMTSIRTKRSYLMASTATTQVSDDTSTTGGGDETLVLEQEEGDAATTEQTLDISDFENDEAYSEEEQQDDYVAVATSTTTEAAKKASSRGGIPIVQVATFLGGAAAARMAFDRFKGSSKMDEEERRRQFELLMGINKNDAEKKKSLASSSAIDVDAVEDVEPTTTTKTSTTTAPATPPPPTTATKKEDSEKGTTKAETKKAPPPKEPKAPPPPPPAAKKAVKKAPPKATKPKRRMVKSIFKKKNKNNRATDLNALVEPEAENADFTILLAKYLTFGAPGRFPAIDELKFHNTEEEPVNMESSTFDLQEATQRLQAAGTTCGITKEQGAEVFANVVNCMLIDIVDLASSSLGQKDQDNKKKQQQVTFDALNIVIEFMNHAASLFDAVAEGVTIVPVTYGGTLSKSVLEEMFVSYSFVGMMMGGGNPEVEAIADVPDRIELLRFVFDISEKKADGLMQKAMQTNMMEMMKTKEGQEEMQEMMSNMMGGMEGMEGMEEMMNMMGGADGGAGGGGAGGEPDPEQLKAMLKQLQTMKNSGQIGKDELKKVRKEFEQMIGVSIEKMEEKAMGTEDQEMLDLVRDILS